MDWFNEILTKLTSVGPELLLGLCTVGLCYVLKLVPVYPDRWIPPVAIFKPAVLYPLLSGPADKATLVRCILIGFLIGTISWRLHKRVEKLLFQDPPADERPPTPPTSGSRP